MTGLFERGRELEQLDAHIGRAAAGDGGVVVVEGPAGIGKSRLLAEARRRADGSLLVLSARGSQLEGEFAFGVVRQLFETRYAKPELLAVDDLHWRDRPSLQFFAYLARRLEGQPILLLAGLREAAGEGSAPRAAR